MKGEKVYNAEDLYFGIVDSTMSEEGFDIILCPKEYFDKTGYLYDSLGGHNVNNTDLAKAGVHPMELMEAIFEPLPGRTREEVATALTKRGFTHKPEMEKLVA